MDRREFLDAPLITPALITPGMSREAARRIFSEQYRLREAARFLPQLKSVGFLLADPLPASQAAALEGVLQERHHLIDVIHWLCVGRGETVEEYIPIAEQERQMREAEADANPNRVRFFNEHDCCRFPDGTRGGIFNTPREVGFFYHFYGDPNWRENLKKSLGLKKTKNPCDEYAA